MVRNNTRRYSVLKYTDAYNHLKDTLELLGYNAYPLGMSSREAMLCPYASIFLYDPKTTSMTQGKTTITGYNVLITVKEEVRAHGVTESDVTLIPKRNSERDANIRSFLEKAGLTNCNVQYRIGYAFAGKNDRALITIIKGEI